MASSMGLAEDWEAIWSKEGVKPGTRWDIGGSYRPLAKLIAAGGVPSGRALVAGCGRGHDVVTLASPSRHVVGLELAPTAAQVARDYISATASGSAPHTTIMDGDFFQHTPEGPYDVAFDYTMLCATLPSRRAEWAAKYKSLLRPGGLLLCGEFPLKPWPAGSSEDLARGPPFQLSNKLYHDLLEPLGFVCESQEPVAPEDSSPIRVGYESFSVWRAPGPDA